MYSVVRVVGRDATVLATYSGRAEATRFALKREFELNRTTANHRSRRNFGMLYRTLLGEAARIPDAEVDAFVERWTLVRRAFLNHVGFVEEFHFVGVHETPAPRLESERRWPRIRTRKH